MSDPKFEKPKLRPGDPDYVGRGFPPKRTQIRKGEVKNPRGRAGKLKPEEADDAFAVEVRRLLNEPIRTTDGKTVTVAAVFVNSLKKGLANNDPRIIKIFIDAQQRYAQTVSRIEVSDKIEYRERLISDALARVAASSEYAAKQSVSNDDEADQQEIEVAPPKKASSGER